MPFELCSDSAMQKKMLKYYDLLDDCRTNGYGANLLKIKVGSRGFLHCRTLHDKEALKTDIGFVCNTCTDSGKAGKKLMSSPKQYACLLASMHHSPPDIENFVTYNTLCFSSFIYMELILFCTILWSGTLIIVHTIRSMFPYLSYLLYLTWIFTNVMFGE